MEPLSLSIEPSLRELKISDSTSGIVNQIDLLPPESPAQDTSNRPYGLPPERTLAEYWADPVCKLSGLNYKVEAAVETSHGAWLQALAVVDTGAGPNLIRADLLTPEKLSKISKDQNIVNLASASGHSLDVLGLINLPVRIGKQVTTTTFVVSRALNADILLGCHYIDKAVEDIHIQRRTIELINGEILPIARRRATTPTLKSSNESPFLSERVRASPHLLRCARTLTVPARTEMFVQVQGTMRGTKIVSSRPALFDRHRCVVANGIADIRPNVPFHVKVANMSEHPVTIRKGMCIASTTPAPHVDSICTIDFDGAQPKRPVNLPDSSKEGVVHGKSKRDKMSPQESKAFKHLNTKEERKADIFDVEDIPLPELNNQQANQVRKMLDPFKEMWRPGKVGKVNVTEHHIDIQPGSKPQFSQPYRAGPYARKVIKNTIDEMLEQDIVEPSKSEWAAPVVLAPKSDGTLRFCVDYRRLNSVTIKDRYPLPRMEDCLDSLGDAKYFSTLDCNWGFWQIPMAKEDRSKTAFTTHAGTFQYKRMPFGLCNAPASYQRTLDILLMGIKWKSCLVYVDDVIIFSRNFNDHVQDVKEVLSILKEAGLSLNMRKCKFFSRTIDYLGHVVSPGRLQVARKNTVSITSAKYPTTQTEMRSFLGMCNVYRRFVPNFAHVAAPLNKYLMKGQSADLPAPKEEDLDAFESLKEALTSPPVLELPDLEKEYSIDADASAYQVGCALFQQGEDGIRHPIGFWSRSLNPAEKNYSAGEREALAIIFAVQTLHPYLWGRHFKVYTDHQALRWVFNLDDPTGRLSRWALRLQDFDFEVRYKKGSDNAVADAVSRLPTYGRCDFEVDVDLPVYIVDYPSKPWISNKVNTDSWDRSDWEQVTTVDKDSNTGDCWDVMAIPDSAIELITVDELLEAQSEDADCEKIMKIIGKTKDSDFEVDARGLIVRISPVDAAEQVVVPKKLRPRALYLGHHTPVAGHPGVSRQYYTMRRTMYWPNMMTDIRECCQRCDACGKERVTLRTHQSPLTLFPANAPLEYVAIDILGPLPRASSGHRFVLVMTDRFSKFSRAIPMRTITAINVAKAFLEYWIFAYGAPQTVITDNGSQFTAQIFEFLCSHMGVRHALTTTYHPQTNGQAERFNRTLLASLRAFAGEHPKSWAEFVGSVTYAYNTQVHSSTKVPPFDLIVTSPPGPMILERIPKYQASVGHRQERSRFRKYIKSLVADAKENLQRSQAAYKDAFDSRIRPLKPAMAGDWVYIENVGPTAESSVGARRRHKLQWKAVGPYKVIRSTGSTVTVERDGLIEVVNRDRTSRAYPPKSDDLRGDDEDDEDADTEPDNGDTNEIPSNEEAAENDGLGNEDDCQSSSEDEGEYVLESILEFDKNSNKFKCRWSGYEADDDTWQHARDIPYSKVVAYMRKHRKKIPQTLKEICRPC